MGLFGLGSKRSSSPTPTQSSPPAAPTQVSATASSQNVGRVRGLLASVTGTTAIGASPQADVEVSELNLDENEFSSTFGAGMSQFPETHFGPGEVDTDPWTSRLRLD
jgi:hypothetical protein